MTVETEATAEASPPWWAMGPTEVADALGVAGEGLSTTTASERLERFGPNQLTAAKSATLLQLALKQVLDPMNLMLIGVTVISAVIGQVSTAIMVGLLVVFNVWSGANQE